MTADHNLPVRNTTAATEVCLNEEGEQERSTTISMYVGTAGRERKTVSGPEAGGSGGLCFRVKTPD